MINRRDFLKNGSLLALSSWLPSTSLANSKAPHFVVLLELSGGWDTTLATDPWVQAERPETSELFIEYRKDELLPFQKNFVGPALKPLEKYFSRMNVINGVFLNSSDLGHPLLKYSQTGHGQGELASLAAEVNYQTQIDNLGTLFNESLYLANRNIMQMKLSDLSYGNFGSSFPLTLSSKSQSSVEKVKSQLHKMRSQIQSLNEAINKLKTENNNKPIRSGQVVAQSFRLGLSQTASLSVQQISNGENAANIDLDTHDQHEGQHKNSLLEGFSRIKLFLDDLAAAEIPNSKGLSVLDQTTVLIVSDFARTPALNASKGKDHNPQTNSMIVMGPGLAKGKMIGSSRLISRSQSPISVPVLVANPLDQITQKPVRRKQDVFMLRPEHIFKTIYSSLGVDIAKSNLSFTDIAVIKDLLK